MSSAYYETKGKMKGTARDLADMMEVMRGYTQGVKDAANAELVKHYVKTFHAEHFPWNHPYQIVLGPYYGKKLLEVYTYEWN